MRIPILIFCLSLAYSLPTMAQQDRGFVADRPGATDNPLTMPRGQYRIESGIITMSRDEQDDREVTEKSVAAMNFVAGWSNNSEVQLSFEPFIENTVEDSSGKETESETGDIVFKYKHNILGNDGASVGLALIPHLTYAPQNGKDKILGGVGIPISIQLPMEIEFSITPQWSIESSTDDTTHGSQYLGMVLGRNFGDNLNAFIEYFSSSSSIGGFEAFSGVGLSYQVGSRVQWDASVDFGLNKQSLDTIASFGVIYAWR